jgi:hypothetical protein
MIAITCKNCGKTLNVPEQYLGQTGKCNHCHSPVEVVLGQPENPPSPASTKTPILSTAIDDLDPAIRNHGRPVVEEWDDPYEKASGAIDGRTTVAAHKLATNRTGGGMSKWQIAGIACAALVLIVLIAIAIFRSRMRVTSMTPDDTIGDNNAILNEMVETAQRPKEAESNSQLLTLAKYHSVPIGMSYEQVKSTLGDPGVLQSEMQQNLSP